MKQHLSHVGIVSDRAATAVEDDVHSALRACIMLYQALLCCGNQNTFDLWTDINLSS